MDINSLDTSCKVTKYLRAQGKNIIPIVPGTKVPPKGFKLSDYFDSMCNVPIKDTDSIAILHGTISNTFGVDIDMKDGGTWKDAIHVLAKDIETMLSKTMVVKTPKQGCHFILSPINELPPKNIKYINQNNTIEIDIKTQGGYTLLPPSIYDQEQYGRYEFISTTLYPNPTSWKDLESHIAQRGFFRKEDINDKNLRNDYNIDKLLIGKFTIGNRRRLQNSLYCKLRIKEYSENDATKKIYEVNKKCAIPLDENEVNYNIRYAEAFFQNIILSNNTSGIEKLSHKDPAKIDIAADILMRDNSFITPRGTEKILLYNGMIYDNYEAEAIIKEKTEELITYCNNNYTIETINKIKRKTFVSLKDIDSDPNSITILNGILNINNQELTEHTPDNISQVLIPVRYVNTPYVINEGTIFTDIKKNLQDTLFYQYLTRSFTINGKFRQENFETILEIMASVLIKKQIDQRAFIFLGGGENGKSILLDYIEYMLGRGTNNVSHIPLHELSDDKFMTAELNGACVNIFSDLEENELKHTGKIKGVISGEGIKVQEKYGQPFDLFPFAKLLFSCNKFPKVYDQSQGFFRRWIIIKWERSFEGDPERVPDLLSKLTSNQNERDLVFSCLIPLANKLNRLGVFSHTKTWREIQKEWNENADPIDAFDNEYIIDSDHHKTKRETYQFYKGIMLEKGETPLGMGQFSKVFEEYHDYDRITTDERTERVWLNIDFRVPKQTRLSF